MDRTGRVSVRRCVSGRPSVGSRGAGSPAATLGLGSADGVAIAVGVALGSGEPTRTDPAIRTGPPEPDGCDQDSGQEDTGAHDARPGRRAPHTRPLG